MPIRVTINGKELKLIPTEAKQTLDLSEEIKTFEVNRNFYIEAETRLEPQKAQETQRRQERKSRDLYSHLG
jgi:ABC-type metal ion transport system substrate-binding protein